MLQFVAMMKAVQLAEPIEFSKLVSKSGLLFSTFLAPLQRHWQWENNIATPSLMLSICSSLSDMSCSDLQT